uniref:Uncharacterized protein n=1 Tax=Panagrellus redivivus TaxID=6233 RepID=A0A7E4V4M3_PANRE
MDVTLVDLNTAHLFSQFGFANEMNIVLCVGDYRHCANKGMGCCGRQWSTLRSGRGLRDSTPIMYKSPSLTAFFLLLFDV